MPQVRRVAIMIDLQWPLKHHQGIFAGVMRYARERESWECEVDLHAGDGLKTAGAEPWYDGVVARATKSLVYRARKAGVPIVNVWFNSPVRGVPAVFYDAERAAELAAKHLLARGLRQFGYLGYPDDRLTRMQSDVFRRTVRAARCGFSQLLVARECGESPATWQKFRNALAGWIDSLQKPVGIMAAHDILARYLISACLRKRLRVPEEVAVVGSSNEPMVCMHPEPQITSIDYGFEEIGYRAAKLLDGLMNGATADTGPVVVPSVELVARQSTDVIAVGDKMVAEALRFMADQGGSRMTVRDVAGHVHATPRTLERRFRRALGRTMSSEIMRLRIERVKRQLVESEAPLKAMAAQLGFHSDKRLCEAFRKVEGITPGEYRRRSRTEEK